MKLRNYIFFFVFICSLNVAAQNALQITAVRLGNVKVYELSSGNMLEYKLKGQTGLFYRHDQIAALRDSMILFADDRAIALNEIKAIRIHKQQHLFKTIDGLFVIGGAMIFAINTFDNVLLKNPPTINPQVAYFCIGMEVVGFLIYEMGIRHLHINKHKTLRIVERNYDNLNSR